MEKQQNNDGEIEIDLMQIMKLLLSKSMIIIVAGLITGLIALLGTKLLITPMYQSTARLYVISRQNDSSTTLTDIQTSTQLVKDYRILVTSTPVMEQVISNLNLNMSKGQLASVIACNIATDSRVLSVTVTHADPYLSKEIVDEVANVSAARIPQVMKIEGVEIVDYGDVPTGQSSPNTLMNTLIGAFLGMIVVIAIIVVRFIMDDTIKNSEDVEKYLGVSTLALIPITEEEFDGASSRNKKYNIFGRKRG